MPVAAVRMWAVREPPTYEPLSDLYVDAHFVPGILNDLLFSTIGEQDLRVDDGQPGELHERRVGFQPRVAQRCVPDGAGLRPGVPAHLGGGDVEGLVRDAGVDVHAAVIVDGVDVVAHARRLLVPLERGPRILHGAQRFSPGRIRPDALADKPVGILGSLFAVVVLLYQGAVHV